MNGYDIIDEAVVDAPADVVWDALVAEFRGAARWWVPANTFETVSGAPDKVGGMVAVTVHTKGVGNGGPKLRFTARTESVVPGRRLTVEYVDGVFRGPADFLLEPLDHGRRTRISMHFRGRAHGKMKLMEKVADIGAEHSKAAQAAFVALGKQLSAVPAGGAR
ncbi:SRPBCC family protein [Streptomyces lushanensis]|uniref:SRPBCC family protein n=1 Tax=Streptomyces lushanensis TaxID=1434255 RepID=UPI000B0C589A|nr:SRPBCC family protein [Streptomyces lushanensis]